MMTHMSRLFNFCMMMICGLLIISCQSQRDPIVTIDTTRVAGVWVSEYNNCLDKPIPLPLQSGTNDYFVTISGHEILELRVDGNYTQILNLTQDGNIPLKKEKKGGWYLDDQFIIHLDHGAWPLAGLAHAEEFDVPVLLLAETNDYRVEDFILEKRMNEKDVLLSIVEQGNALHHAAPANYDRDSGSCGRFLRGN